MLGGLLAGLLAAMVFPILAASLVTLAAEFGAAGLMPDANTELIIPKGAVIRLLWLGLTAGLLGLTIPGLAAKRAPRAGRRAPAAEADA
jgi:hypothetical protein